LKADWLLNVAPASVVMRVPFCEDTAIFPGLVLLMVNIGSMGEEVPITPRGTSGRCAGVW
jgi:hypothetical protein